MGDVVGSIVRGREDERERALNKDEERERAKILISVRGPICFLY